MEKSLTLSHKICLDPTRAQVCYFQKACGIARFTWNWALARWQEEYQQGEKPNGLKLKKMFNALKESDYPWVYEVTKYASQQPFIFLQTAFQRFFKQLGSYPKFKRKGIHDCFYIGNDHIKLKGRNIHIPKLGWVRMREVLRFSGRVLSATISRVANKWFVSLNVELDQAISPCKSHASTGVDLGIHHLATLSNGTVFESSKPLTKYLSKLKKRQRRLSRKEPGSNNRKKARLQVAKQHNRVSCIRKDTLHKLTTHLCKQYKEITIEDLNVKGMMRNRCLSKAISDIGLYEFRRQLEYKSKLYGNRIRIANRWFPSSKQCSNCHTIKNDLKLSERLYRCEVCDLEIDRDVNAAINLLNYTVSSTELEACGENCAGIIQKGNVKQSSLKQEPGHV